MNVESALKPNFVTDEGRRRVHVEREDLRRRSQVKITTNYLSMSRGEGGTG
jgi:hypothetical protein